MKECVYDNPQTYSRERWVDGELKEQVSYVAICNLWQMNESVTQFRPGKLLSGHKSAMHKSTYDTVLEEVSRQSTALRRVGLEPEAVFLGEREWASAVVKPALRPFPEVTYAQGNSLLFGLRVCRIKQSGVFVVPEY